MSLPTAEFAFPTTIRFGPGVRSCLPDVLAELSATRPLIVCDPGIIDVGLRDAITEALDGSGVAWETFIDLQPNPVEANVDNGAAVFKDSGCDAIIGLGGGSALDVAKAIRLRVSHDLPLVEYDDLTDGWKKIHGEMPPMVAFPTTAGTGSEVGRSAVIMLDATQRKTVLFSRHLMPNVAVLDPELTVGLPPHLTAATGIDALTHSVEAYLSTPFHPICDGIALHGIRLCAEALPKAYDDGADIVARGTMMLAAAMGATAFQKGLGVVHSLAHPLSTLHGVHHGIANAVLLGAALQWNAEAVPAKMRDVAKAMGRAVEGLSVEAGGREGVDAIRDLCWRVGIRQCLSDLGIEEDHLPEMVERAYENGIHKLNPRPVTKDDMLTLYRAAM